jgi:hypothetical protein
VGRSRTTESLLARQATGASIEPKLSVAVLAQGLIVLPMFLAAWAPKPVAMSAPTIPPSKSATFKRRDASRIGCVHFRGDCRSVPGMAAATRPPRAAR